MLQRITPCLSFDTQGEEAARFYVSLFGDGRVVRVLHYSEAAANASGMPEGSVLTVDFELKGQPFVGLNAGPAFKFTPAISFMVSCETQAEIDRLWEALSEGGQTMECSWLTDRYGVPWQIMPAGMLEMLQDPDPEKAARTMRAMLQMTKLDMATLQAAYDGPRPG
jgi:predicted 3-demethylubiquinone-9 3-methyltransferase (glyoxalase superfamily)